MGRSCVRNAEPRTRKSFGRPLLRNYAYGSAAHHIVNESVSVVSIAFDGYKDRALADLTRVMSDFGCGRVAVTSEYGADTIGYFPGLSIYFSAILFRLPL